MADELDALLGAAVDYFGDDALDLGKDVLGDVIGAGDAATFLDVAGRLAGGDGGSLLEEYLGEDARDLLGGALGGAAVSLGGGLLDRAVDEVSGTVRDEVEGNVGGIVGDVPQAAGIAWGEGAAMAAAATAVGGAGSDDLAPLERGIHQPDLDEVVRHDAGSPAGWDTDPVHAETAVPDGIQAMDPLTDLRFEPVPEVPEMPAIDVGPSTFEIELDAADAYESSVDSLFEGA